ncbi:MAG: anthranilate phosphoribosyltransferase [Gemmatimonadetes bacterium]|nr:anthranilate phosphoribosyltransferase [Gemmatimonadota bacterium]
MTTSESAPDLVPQIATVSAGESLTAEEAEAAFLRIMEGGVSPVQVAAFLVALRTKGPVPEEVAGGVRALRRTMIPVPAAEPELLIDTCGTGGGSVTTFNISTAAALVAAGAGVRIAKHGNRSFTSRCGSADVLEALGVRIELSPEAMAKVLDRVGIVFMFAPLLHPAMRHVAPVRRELRIPTIMNLLGPLTNPAGARRQLVGVSEHPLLDLVAGALQRLGHRHALVVYGYPGMDELSPVAPSEVREVCDGQIRRFRLDPAELGWEPLPLDGLRGAGPAENASLIGAVLEGRERGTARAAAVLNAGATLFLAGRASSIADGIELAKEAVDSGAAAAKLAELREATRAFA